MCGRGLSLQVAEERRQALRLERRARVRAAVRAVRAPPEAAEAYQAWKDAATRLRDASMSRGVDDLVAGGVPLDVLGGMLVESRVRGGSIG